MTVLMMLVAAAQALALSVVVPADCPQERAVVADDVAQTLTQMTGEETRILKRDPGRTLPDGPKVLLGDEFATRLDRTRLSKHVGYDGYIMRSLDDETLLLCGRNEAGHANAAYGWLRELGCRWLMPGPNAEVIPRVAEPRLGGWDEVEEPAWVHRNLWYSGLKQFREQAPEETAAATEELAVWQRRNRMGQGVPVRFGHSFLRVMPAAGYFETHPDYFALQGGERIPNGQLCTTNEDVIEIFADAAIAAFDEDPDLKSFSLSPNDGYGWCHCEACEALDSPEARGTERGKADRVVTFANEVARRVKERHPDRWLAFYAYAGCVKPPTYADPDDNVLVVLTHYIMDSLRPINDPDSKWNATFREYLDGWSAVSEQMFLREYYCRWWAPWPMWPAPAGDIPWLTERNFNGFNAELECRSEGAEIGWYVLGQLLWDPEQDSDALLDEYFTGLYGPAAGAMREYFETLREAADNPDLRARGGEDEIPKLFPPELIARARELLRPAEAAAETEAQRFQVQRSVDAMQLNGAFYDLQAAIREAVGDLDDAHRETLVTEQERAEAVLERIHGYDLARYWSAHDEGSLAPLLADARLLLGMDTLDPWAGDFRKDAFRRQALSLARMVASEGIRWSDSANSGYVYGNDCRAAWYVRAEAPIESCTLKALTYDTNERAGWIEWQLSFDRGETWETVARVDGDGWKRDEWDLTEHLAGHEDFVLAAYFAPGANARARLAEVAVYVK